MEHDDSSSTDGAEQELIFESPIRSNDPHRTERWEHSPVHAAISPNDDSVHLNELDRSDEPAVALLKQIFPQESYGSLRTLHKNRCLEEDTGATAQADLLPEDFLRLPPEVAVRRCIDGKWQYEIVKDLEDLARNQHFRRFTFEGTNCDVLSFVVEPEAERGLGMTIVEDEGFVRVHWLDGLDDNEALHGPALKSGIQCGDVVFGIDGLAFVESFSRAESTLVQHAVSRLKGAGNPVILHVLRYRPNADNRPAMPSLVSTPIAPGTPSLLDTTDFASESSGAFNESFQSDATPVIRTRFVVHPFIKLLGQRGLILSSDQLHSESRQMKKFEARAKQWEELSSFRIPSADIVVPLIGVRKALSVRIVNTFQEGDETAYTIWVHDGETGREWYAPVRYFRDFADLRAAMQPLCSNLEHIPFPKARSSLSIFRSPKRLDSGIQIETKCRQLEYFVRCLCAMIYRDEHPYVAEIAIHVQSFLGCEENLPDQGIPKAIFSRVDDAQPHRPDNMLHRRLRSSLQRYVYRVFLLDTIVRVVNNFVDTMRTRGPRLQEIEALEAKGNKALKDQAINALQQIQKFLDEVQEMIVEGCAEDFDSMLDDPCFSSLRPLFRGTQAADSEWERIVREAVREQVEIEIYVPLRSVASRWLVYGWRHEDMEIQFKIKELRKRPQEFFRIAHGKELLDWSSVSGILEKGVGLSTLPCVKLRAIVAAAREIFRIYKGTQADEAAEDPLCSKEEKADSQIVNCLGADEFLPIFIYTVVQTEMERPCALCVLLRTLCDRINKIGEIGYYLLSFEAAITHCHEVDLTEDQEEMQSFLSVPLSDA